MLVPAFTRGGLYLKAGREHARRDDEIGDDEAGHAKGEKDRLAGICDWSTTVNGFLGSWGAPGCSVESTIFFAFHSSGVMAWICPCLYEETSFFALSRPAAETKRVLFR